MKGRLMKALEHPATPSVLLVACLVGILGACVMQAEARAESRTRDEETIRLLEQIAGNARDPLVMEWVTVRNGRIRVMATIEPGETDAEWLARFDSKVAERMAKYPPAESFK